MNKKGILPLKAQQFFNDWIKPVPMNADFQEELEEQLLIILKEAFTWGRISTASKTRDTKMEFTFEEWVKTNQSSEDYKFLLNQMKQTK